MVSFVASPRVVANPPPPTHTFTTPCPVTWSGHHPNSRPLQHSWTIPNPQFPFTALGRSSICASGHRCDQLIPLQIEQTIKPATHLNTEICRRPTSATNFNIEICRRRNSATNFNIEICRRTHQRQISILKFVFEFLRRQISILKFVVDLLRRQFSTLNCVVGFIVCSI